MLLAAVLTAGCVVAPPEPGERTDEDPPASSASEGYVDGKADRLDEPSLSPCADGFDCDEGAACRDGDCVVVACSQWKTCGSSEVCAAEKCSLAMCDAALRCDDGEACVAGKCVPETNTCIDGLDCAPDEVCVFSTCVNPRCETDADCNDSVCVGGTCRALTCSADRDCASREVCRAGRCVVPSDEP